MQRLLIYSLYLAKPFIADRIETSFRMRYNYPNKSEIHDNRCIVSTKHMRTIDNIYKVQFTVSQQKKKRKKRMVMFA